MKNFDWSGVWLSIRFPVLALLIDFLRDHSSEKNFLACFFFLFPSPIQPIEEEASPISILIKNAWECFLRWNKAIMFTMCVVCCGCLFSPEFTWVEDIVTRLHTFCCTRNHGFGPEIAELLLVVKYNYRNVDH